MDILLGVAHGDDLQYIFSELWGEDLPMSETDLAFSKNVFIPLLVNFAKSGYISYKLTLKELLFHF